MPCCTMCLPRRTPRALAIAWNDTIRDFSPGLRYAARRFPYRRADWWPCRWTARKHSSTSIKISSTTSPWWMTGALIQTHLVNFKHWDTTRTHDKDAAEALQSLVTDRYLHKNKDNSNKQTAQPTPRTPTWRLV